MLERLFGPLARRWAWVAVALRVQKRFDEVHGGSLAAAVTLSAFLSLFPLLLVLIGVIGFFSFRTGDLTSEVIARLGLTGDAARMVTLAIAKAEESRRFASVLGFAGLLWSGLAVVGSIQRAMNAVWQVAGRGLADKLYALAWLAGAAVLLVVSFGATAALGLLPGPAAPPAFVASFAAGVALWLWTMCLLTNRPLGWRALLPGALLAAAGLEALKLAGGYVVPRAVARSSGLYGSIGTVFAILAWLLVLGRLVVYAAVVNVVRWEDRHGTVKVEIALPNVPGDGPPLEASRAGEAVPVEASRERTDAPTNGAPLTGSQSAPARDAPPANARSA